MPPKSPAQRRLMEAAAHNKGGFGGVPQAVGKEFVSMADGGIADGGVGAGNQGGQRGFGSEGSTRKPPEPASWKQHRSGLWMSSDGKVAEKAPEHFADGGVAGADALPTSALELPDDGMPPEAGAPETTDATAPIDDDQMLSAIANLESPGLGYAAKSHSTSAAGKYQMILGTAQNLAAQKDSTGAHRYDLPAFAREQLASYDHSDPADRADYQDWLIQHPGVQEQLARANLNDLKQSSSKARNAPNPTEAARQLATDWNFGPNTDMTDTTPVPNNKSRAERAKLFDGALAKANTNPGIDSRPDVTPGVAHPVEPLNLAGSAGQPQDMEFRPMVQGSNPAAQPSFSRAAPTPPRPAQAPPGTHQDAATGQIIDDKTMLPVEGAQMIPGTEGDATGGAVPAGTLATEQAQRAAPAAAPVLPPTNRTPRAPGGAAAPGTAAQPPDPFEQQWQTVNNALTEQRKKDDAWGASNETMLTQMRADALSGKIDPSRIFSSMSTAHRILAAVALGLGAGSNALTGHGNPALEMMQAAINADVEAQKDNLGRKVTVYGQALQQFGQERAARQATTQILWDQARLIMQEMRYQNLLKQKLAFPAAKQQAGNEQVQGILDNVAQDYQQYIGQSGLTSYLGEKIHQAVPLIHTGSGDYMARLQANARALMSAIPGARVNPETLKMTMAMLPQPGVSHAENVARMMGLRHALKNNSLSQILAEQSGVLSGGASAGQAAPVDSGE